MLTLMVRPEADVEGDVVIGGTVDMENEGEAEGIVAVQRVNKPRYRHLLFCESAAGFW
jgi:hypothetical protein